MKTSANLLPLPRKITATFFDSVAEWGHGTKGYGVPVKKVTINNPYNVQYHTYGNGIITYFVEWFSESVRPLEKYQITFDTLNIKSITFENEKES